MWYLSYEAVGLSFFDEQIPVDVKQKMDQAFRRNIADAENLSHNRNAIQPQHVHLFQSKTIDYFISNKTAMFFKRFKISTEFMDSDPSFWSQCPSYNEGLEVVKKMLVVNDVSERKAKLMQEFNEILANDEEQKQFLLLTVKQ